MAHPKANLSIHEKQCTKCKQMQPIAEFNLKHDHNRPDWRWYDAWCKTCYRIRARKERAEKPELCKTSKLKTERFRRAKAEEFVMEYLKTHPCIDCDESDIIVLEFDHLPQFEKRNHVTYMVSHQWGLKSIEAEIAKCEVVCANCHKRRTAKRQGWARAKHVST